MATYRSAAPRSLRIARQLQERTGSGELEPREEFDARLRAHHGPRARRAALSPAARRPDDSV
ncbi:hypothetical protein ACFU7Y_00325 [Kitasatospora sp. NPDC057542]|uniref:hypothetical protein n=1 Tax=Streptomycetaceae TaxID=2062 RepID=UPI001CCC157C|nr:hypothetical protein [Streptomyces sp. LS1784]